MEQTHQGPGEFSVSYDREDVLYVTFANLPALVRETEEGVLVRDDPDTL